MLQSFRPITSHTNQMMARIDYGISPQWPGRLTPLYPVGIHWLLPLHFSV